MRKTWAVARKELRQIAISPLERCTIFGLGKIGIAGQILGPLYGIDQFVADLAAVCRGETARYRIVEKQGSLDDFFVEPGFVYGWHLRSSSLSDSIGDGLPANCRLGHNEAAFLGGFRLWVDQA